MIMANFFQDIINKITGHQDNSQPAAAAPIAPLDISHVAMAAAAVADPKAEAAKQQADQAELAQASATAPDMASHAEGALKERDEAAMQAAQAVADAADQFEIIKEHTLTPDDMLSALALHFYGHATPEYWGLIILANKNTVGSSVKDYTPGKVIKIPKLPDSMKK
jgi:nucleoid-associated protein YgaU